MESTLVVSFKENLEFGAWSTLFSENGRDIRCKILELAVAFVYTILLSMTASPLW